jgi:hypothetical protein
MMKRLLTIILLIVSVNSYAEWTLIGGSDGYFVYADKATIRRNGDFVKMWSLTDFKTVQKVSGDSYLSQKMQTECDCKEERSRMLAFSWFSGQMGSGTVVYFNGDAGKWTPIEPVSIGEKMWKIACGKK